MTKDTLVEILVVCGLLAIGFFFLGGWTAVFGVLLGWAIGLGVCLLFWKLALGRFLG